MDTPFGARAASRPASPKSRKIRRRLREKCPRPFLLLLAPELRTREVAPELITLTKQIAELLHERGLEDTEARGGEREQLGGPRVHLVIELRHRDNLVHPP